VRQDLRGQDDLFGRPLMVTEVGTADELAAAASLLQGQADEGKPVVLVRGYEFTPAPDGAQDLVRAAEEDMFR
ncbi:MAG: coenzyme F420-0:L-glutamate ligase, partial [Thiotrichales bacterium]|nr:coenzyme F420-0:L-glutamate ligase [Thiotrichales bacterium]